MSVAFQVCESSSSAVFAVAHIDQCVYENSLQSVMTGHTELQIPGVSAHSWVEGSKGRLWSFTPAELQWTWLELFSTQTTSHLVSGLFLRGRLPRLLRWQFHAVFSLGYHFVSENSSTDPVWFCQPLGWCFMASVALCITWAAVV